MDRRHRDLRDAGLPAHPQLAAALVSVGSGAAMGATIGFFAAAGLPGVVAGAILGAATGAGIAAYVAVRSKHERTNELDSFGW